MCTFLDEREFASEIATQIKINKLGAIVFPGYITNYLAPINFERRIEDMRKFYPREYIDAFKHQTNLYIMGVKSQIR